MGLLTPCFVPRGGILYTMVVPGGGRFLLPLSRLPGVCPGGMVLDEVDTCINVKADSYVAVHRYEYDVQSMVLIIFIRT